MDIPTGDKQCARSGARPGLSWRGRAAAVSVDRETAKCGAIPPQGALGTTNAGNQPVGSERSLTNDRIPTRLHCVVISMSQLDREWTNFQVEAEVDTFGVGRLVAEHNRIRKLAANGSGLDAEECLLRVRRFIRDELKRIEPAFDSVEFGNIKGFADLVDQLIVEILG